MDLFPSPEQTLLTETAADFATRSVDPETVRTLEASAAGFDRARWATMVELGWTELDPLELALVVEQLGRRAVPSPLVQTGALRNALPGLAGSLAPDAIVTGCALVPGAVDEWSGPHPSVTDGETVTGTYLLVPFAGDADRLVCAVAGGLVVVDPLAAGVTRRRHDTVGGDPQWRVDLAGVPGAPVVGDLATMLDHTTITALAYAIGAAEGALALAVQHAKDREQFGRPIGSFQAVAHRCADMRAEIDACRVLTLRAAWTLGRGGDHRPAVESALTYSKDALRRVAMHAHQVHGAIGFSSEHDLHLFTRRIKAFELTGGGTAAHQERLAAAIGLRW